LTSDEGQMSSKGMDIFQFPLDFEGVLKVIYALALLIKSTCGARP
jgi:hypothetical protein